MRTTILGLITFALLTLAACGGGSTGTPSADGAGPPSVGDGDATAGGMLRVSVTDDPFPADYVLEASVDIAEIQAHDQESGRWVVVSTETFTINLVGLSNGITDTIVDQAIDPGTYDQFRFLTGPGRVVLDAERAVVEDDSRLHNDLVIETPEGEIVADGYVFTVEDGGVRFPSGPRTGIKVKIDPPIVVTSELSGDLVLEFDLARNFVFNGPVTHRPGVKRVLFTPSVKASNGTENGSVRVIVLGDEGVLEDAADDEALENAEVWIVDGDGGKVTSTFTDESGLAKLSAAPGTYTLKADKFGYQEGTLAGVQIVLANLEDAGTLTLRPTGISITGTVYTEVDTSADTSDDYVIAGVLVTLQLLDGTTVTYEDTATSDESGSFTFDGLETDTYDLTFTKNGFEDLETTWSTADEAMTVRMTPLQQAVTATVEDASQNGVSGATVTATDANENTWTATTDTNGDAGFTLPTGTYTFTATDASSNAYAAAEALDVEGDDDDATSDTVALTPSSS